MDDPFFQFSLGDLKSVHLQWEIKRRALWSVIASRPELRSGISDLQWLQTRVFCWCPHPFKRRRNTQFTDGVEHSPETHPGWLTDEGTHTIDADAGDDESSEVRTMVRSARGLPSSLHVGPTVLLLRHGPVFLAAVSKTLVAAVIQCMPNHPLHPAYMEHAKDARDRLAHVPREQGKGFEELRGIRFELPTHRTLAATDRGVRLRRFAQYSSDERMQLYRRVHGADCQVPAGNKPASQQQDPSNGCRIAPMLPTSGTYVLFSPHNLAMGQRFSGDANVAGIVTGKTKVGPIWEYRVTGFRASQEAPNPVSTHSNLPK